MNGNSAESDQLNQLIKSLTNAYSDETLDSMDVSTKESTYRALLGNMTEKEAARAGRVHLNAYDRLNVNSEGSKSKYGGAFGDMLRGEDR